MLTKKFSQKSSTPSETDEAGEPGATVGTLKESRYNFSYKQLIIFALVFAGIGGYIIVRSFASTITSTKVWDSNADWSASILSNTTVNNGSVGLAPISSPTNTGTNLALKRPGVASSTNKSGSGQNLPVAAAFDGNLSTRWGSQYSDPQWIYVDLGSTYNINQVKLTWEVAYGKAYQIQVSNDAKTWKTIYSTSNATGGVNTIKNLSGSGRYVRMYGTQRGTKWGYSLWEMAVYGTPTTAATYAASGTATLNYDTGTSATWRSLSAQTTLPAGTKIAYQARSSADNITWSAWNSDVTQIPKNRYIQIQATLSTTNTSVTPLLNSLTLSYDATVAAPTVSLISPANGATVSGATNLAANATSNTGVAKVEFYANNSLVSTDTSSPYSATWNTAAVSDGSYAIVAKAYDTANNVATSGTVNVTVSNGSSSGVPTGPSPYTRLVWSDEFNGAAGTQPDPAKWSIITGTGNGCTGFGNNELETYTNRPSNVVLDGRGALNLIARKETYTASDNCARNYTSGRIETRNKYTLTYGHMEARVLTPPGKGLWPAFWSLGSSWPNSGEIDTMEELDQDPYTLHANIHGPTTSGSSYGYGTSYKSPGALTGGYHVYGVTWQPDSVSWQLDGQQYFSVSRSQIPSSYKWVFDQPEWMVLNLAVGGDWPGPPDSTTSWPSTMSVDWVRAFQ